MILRGRTSITLAALLALAGFAPAARAQDPRTDFRQNCSNCHTIGGGALVGPDLKDVSRRQKRSWLAEFITDPNAKLDGGDPYAQQLLAAARGQRMTPVLNMNSARASALLDLIEAESALEKSEFAGLQMPDRDFTAADVAAGRALFIGETMLEGGGAPCLSCHTVGGLSGLSGGKLGPDLTLVYERLQGRKALAQWLSAPATEQMKAVFTDRALTGDEIFALTAFFEDAAKTRREDDAPAALVFALLGLGGAALAFAGFGAIWRGRFTAVRRPLVHAARESVP